MENIGKKRICFTGSRKVHERVVKKDASGKYWARWYGQNVEVIQSDGFEHVTEGWKTVEPY